MNGVAAVPDQNADLGLGKVMDKALQNGQDWVGGIADTEDNFVFGVVLAAEAGEVLVRIRIESTDWLQIADRRLEVGGSGCRGTTLIEEPNRAEDRESIVNEGDSGDSKKDISH